MDTHRYLPMTEIDKKEMLELIGVESIEELLGDIPESTRFNRTLAIEKALKEPELVAFFEQLANENKSMKDFTSYLGAGVYEHYSHQLLIMLFLAQNFTRPTRLTSQKSLKVSFKRFLNSKR